MGIKLQSDELESGAFTGVSGRHLIQAGVTSGNSLPDTVTLQTRHKDENGDETAWLDTGIVLSATDGWQQVVFTSSEVEYNLVASAIGATVIVSIVDSTRSN